VYGHLNAPVMTRDLLRNRRRPADDFRSKLGNADLCIDVTVINLDTFVLTEALNTAADNCKKEYIEEFALTPATSSLPSL